MWAHTESQRGERLLPPAHPHMLSWGMLPLLAIPTPCTSASLTSQQPLGDAEGTHQVFRKVQVGRLLTKLGEALGQGCAPQPVLPRTQGHVQQMAWRGRERGGETDGSRAPKFQQVLGHSDPVPESTAAHAETGQDVARVG